jgi:hypothetical protein
MKDSLTRNNAGDFRQRYEGTYGMYSHNVKEPLLVMLTSVNAARCLFQDKRGVEYRVNSDTGIPFEFLPVERRVANYKDTVLYGTRRPQRQWQRGVCDGNTTITDLSYMGQLPVSFDTIEALYQSPKNYDEELTAFKKERRKLVAISDKFVLTGTTLMIYDRPIGLYEKGTVKVDKLFLQEVKDVNVRNKLGLTVEVLNG